MKAVTLKARSWPPNEQPWSARMRACWPRSIFREPRMWGPNSARAVALAQPSAPPLFHPSQAPDQQRGHPCRDEHPHDDEAEGACVDVLEPCPEGPACSQLLGKQATQLDRSDDQGDGDRKPGDREVVEDLADRKSTRLNSSH